jgi:hypothetical protein
MSALKPEVRKRMMIVGPTMAAFFTIMIVYLISERAPTSVVAVAAMGLMIFSVMFIFAYAWPHMTVDAGLRCPRCGAEIQEDFVACPACAMMLK